MKLTDLPSSMTDWSSLPSSEHPGDMAGGYVDHAPLPSPGPSGCPPDEAMDSTKLDGLWDFDLEWTARAALAAKGSDGISVSKRPPSNLPIPTNHR